MANIGGILGNGLDTTNQMGQIAIQAAQAAMAAALQGGQLTAQMQGLSNEGMLAGMQLQLASTQNNAMMDTATMGQRAAFTAMAKQTDQFAYNEMMREKITNLFIDMEKQRTDNAFQRSKSAVQSMKY
jgi:hypothetical protein